MIFQFYKKLETIFKLKLIKIFLSSLLNSLLEILGIGLIPALLFFLIKTEELNSKIENINSFFNSNLQTPGTIEIILVFGLIYVLKIFTVFLIKIYQINFWKKIRLHISDLLVAKFSLMSYKQFKDFNTSKIIRNINLDIQNFASNILDYVQIFTDFIILFIVMLLLFFFLNLKFVVVIIIIGIFFQIIYFFFKKKLIKAGQQSLYLQRAIIDKLKLFYNAFKIIKIFQVENFIYKDFSRTNNHSLKLSAIAKKINLFPRLFFELILVVITLVSILFWKLNGLNIEEHLPVLSFYIISVLRIYPLFNSIILSYNNIKFKQASFSNILNQINYNSKQSLERKKVIDNINFKEKISLKNVSFKYKKKTILSKINFYIKKNQFIIITGESGSGKTTLVDIIMGILYPSKGEVFSDNFSIKGKEQTWLNKFGFVPQDILMMDKNVKQNIIFFNKFEKNRFYQSLKHSGLNNYKNYSKNIGEGAKKISGGQAQRVSIARSLYLDKDILVLDEPTSNLDYPNSMIIKNTLKKLKGKKTIIIISHNKLFYDLSDKIYEIKNCKINTIK